MPVLMQEFFRINNFYILYNFQILIFILNFKLFNFFERLNNYNFKYLFFQQFKKNFPKCKDNYHTAKRIKWAAINNNHSRWVDIPSRAKWVGINKDINNNNRECSNNKVFNINKVSNRIQLYRRLNKQLRVHGNLLILMETAS